MNIYFTINQKQFKEHLAYLGTTGRKPLNIKWLLNDNTVSFFNINSSKKDCLNDIDEYGKANNMYGICKAKISNKDLIEGLRAAMCGDAISDTYVWITNIWWIKR